MKIIHISAECYPVAKVGGLADVVGSLPKYQNKLGVETAVVMPYYETKFNQNSTYTIVHSTRVVMGDSHYEASVLALQSSKLGYPLYSVKIPGLLDRENVYGYADDTERFLAFQKATLDWFLHLETKPELVHCHDHHTGLIPFMMSKAKKYESFRNTPSVLTIHNAQYMGSFI